MIEKPKRPKKPDIQERQPPRTLQELINRYDLDNTKVYDFLDELVGQINENDTSTSEGISSIIEDIASLQSQINDKNIITAGGTSSITATGTGDLKIPITRAIEQVGNKFTITNNRIYVGAGVSKVLVSALAYFNLVANRGGALNFSIRKNGSWVAGLTNGGYNYASVTNANLAISPRLVSVQEGDYFEYYAYLYNGDVARSDSSTNTYLTVEVIE